jgi:2,4-dienoyl-CoA reductase-like NADH-dependent reductase (Old Yellow Enzyme family)
MSVEALFEPLQIKNLHLKNRIVMSPMSRYQNAGGIPNDDFAEYHRERAAGGLGLTITGATAVDRPAANNHPRLANINDTARPGWEKVVNAVHGEDCPIVLQMWHAGALHNVDPAWQPGPLESPSGLVAPGKQVGTPMTEEQIADCIDAFVRAAEMAKEIGFDTVEIHAAHGFLLDEFFWEGTNLRQDRWGGRTLAERSRFVREIISAVRAVIDESSPLLLRISQWKEQDYAVKLAKTPAEMEAWLTPMIDAGVDLLSCSQRRFWEPEFPGSPLNFAGWAKKLTGIPVITAGSVGLSNDVMSFFHGETARRTSLDELVRRLEAEEFDLVAVGRAVLADPLWIARIRDGRELEMPDLKPEQIMSWV